MNIKMEVAREYGVSDYQFDEDGNKESFKHRYCRITLKGSGKDGSDLRLKKNKILKLIT